jgi:hypothetical protein
MANIRLINSDRYKTKIHNKLGLTQLVQDICSAIASFSPCQQKSDRIFPQQVRFFLEVPK